MPSYYRNNLDDKWADIHIVFKDNVLVIGGGGVDAIMFHKVLTDGQTEDFEFSVDKRRFFEAVKFFGKEFSMENEDSQYLRLTKDSKAIRLIPSTPDPTIRSLIMKSFDYFGKESDEKLRIKKEEFEVARNFTSEDRIRDSLLNVCIKDGYMYGTNGHILSSIKIEDPPKKELLITQFSPIDFDYDTYLHNTKNFYIFSNDNTVIFQNKITTPYPNVKKIVDGLEGTKITFKRKDALYALRFLSGMGDGGVDFGIIEDQLTLRFADTKGRGISDQAGDRLDITNTMKLQTTVRLDLKYLLTLIKSTSFENVKFRIPKVYGSPCYIKEKDNHYIIMPVAFN